MQAMFPNRTTLFAAATSLIALQVCALHVLGQPWIAADGVVRVWEGDALSPLMSQELSDWYSFSHIIHGFIFFWLTKWLAPRLPLSMRLLICMGIEIAWEMAENSPFVIGAYRRQALAAGYAGDSILNSVSDVAMMAFGFFIASRLRGVHVIALALAFEVFTICMIRDGLALNVLNFIAPIKAIHDWQAGAGVEAPRPVGGWFPGRNSRNHPNHRAPRLLARQDETPCTRDTCSRRSRSPPPCPRWREPSPPPHRPAPSGD